MILPGSSKQPVFGAGIDTARYGHHVNFLGPDGQRGRQADLPVAQRHALGLHARFSAASGQRGRSPGEPGAAATGS